MKPFKGAFLGILFSIPLWIIMVFVFIKCQLLGIILISTTVIIFLAMSIVPFIKKDYGE